MSSTLAKALKEAQKNSSSNTLKRLALKQKFANMFIIAREDRQEVRTGLHASAIIAGDDSFCYREQVLSLIYKQNQGEQLPVKALQIFEAGESIHVKWQTLFEKCSGKLSGFKLIKNEARSYSEKYHLLFTPDAIVEIDNVKYIVEIKSMNTFAFKHAIESKNPHPSGQKQCNLYMHLTGIRHGLLLLEDKNTQDFELFPIEYDREAVLPYIDRLITVNIMYEDLLKNKVVPQRKCKNSACKRAESCMMRDACFGIKRERINA